jgi:[NiFe] hydrogenase diaphorase moiety large subunit
MGEVQTSSKDGRSVALKPGVAEMVHETIRRHRGDPLQLLQILREVNQVYTHIPEEAIQSIATGLWIPRAEVEGVSGFYSFLHTVPHGRFDILLSNCIIDELAGGESVAQALARRLDVKPGETRGDGLVGLDYTSCTGLCDQGPAALINGYSVPHLDPARIDRLVELIEGAVPVAQWPSELLEVKNNLQRTERLLGATPEPGAALRALLGRGPEAILSELKDSGLRGSGGAGFPTANKWASCAHASGAAHFVVCNADEGEPGTFKDRFLLQRHPELVIEGMTLCGGLIGARQGYLYLRGEYQYLVEPLMGMLEQHRRAGLLGENILGRSGFSFDIAIHLGAGAYVCGEESALLESLEGKRGIPRKRPPFPTSHGYREQPTVVNNVETFAHAVQIAVEGGAWFRAQGTADSPGTKLLSISGDCAHPGIYEYPFGTRVEEVLSDCGADHPHAVQIGGAAGHTLPAREFQRRIAFEDVATSGSVMVFGQQRDLLQVVRNLVGFFAHESCGFCTPCRVGTQLVKQLVEKVYQGHGSELELAELKNLAQVMQHASHCGLGQTAGNPVLDTLEKFPELWRDRLRVASFDPAFDLDGALEAARQVTGRDDRNAHF